MADANVDTGSGLDDFFSGLWDGVQGTFQQYLNYRIVRNDASLSQAYYDGMTRYYTGSAPVTGSGAWSNPNAGLSAYMPLILIGGVAVVGAALLLRR
ncbi:hypothetical protein [Hoeflea sp.]|uniref:hypothetical protein n=1 Tax=Hoeflea sp. TaxID=1940281 RepID=UPI0019B9B1BA|nr:hypothetical protein [Hoeflea sp.]MBC7286221.1 hypothetical protein [Hoeflea sp.]